MATLAGLESQLKQLQLILRDMLKFGSLAQETANIVQVCVRQCVRQETIALPPRVAVR